MVRTLNLGILAHVDAGKTSLTERLLHTSGVIDHIGRVDHGDTQTDSMALERQRGITIRSAVASFAVDDVTVNLIDTPGHPDFIAEVERVLNVLDGAVLVVSAVEGVQAQTTVLMRTLQRLRIPTVIFINKIDRTVARPDEVVQEILDRLTPVALPMSSPVAAQIDLLTLHDDDLLREYVEGDGKIPEDTISASLSAQAQSAAVHPILFGSAVTGAGIESLIDALTTLLPANEGDSSAPASGSVFKVERDPGGTKIAYVRMFAGTIRTRDKLRLPGNREGRITDIAVFDHGSNHGTQALMAGQIGRLRGLADVRIGDAIGHTEPAAGTHYFAPPSLETIVKPGQVRDTGALHAALTQLAEQDPLINLRHDDIRRELSVSLYGEVQKEVIQSTLATDYGLDVTFRPTTTICTEQVAGTGSAMEQMKGPDNPFLATVGLRVEPGPVHSGVQFHLEVEPGAMPSAFFTAVEETVRAALLQGLHGWEIPDARVIMTHSGYAARQSHAHAVFDKSMSSTAGDFRGLTPLVLVAALREAGTVVSEPVHSFRMEFPADTFSQILPALSRHRAVPLTPHLNGTTSSLEGEVPAATVHALQQQLPSLTRGEGALTTAFDHYAPVRQGTTPTRPRTDHDPLDRKAYLLQVVRRT